MTCKPVNKNELTMKIAQSMKTKLGMLNLVKLLCCAIVLTSNAQTVRTWTGLQDGVGLDLAGN